MSSFVPNVFCLAARGANIAFRNPPLPAKIKSMNCVKQFFVNRKNHLTRFSTVTAGVDKTLKFTIASLDFSKLMTQRYNPESASLPGLSAAHTGFKDARSVLGLFNAFQGSIPGMVSSVKLCNKLVCGMRQKQPALSLTNDDLRPIVINNYDNVMPPHRYCDIAVGKRQQLSKIAESMCNVVSAGSYAFTFAFLRPLMLVNQYERFLSSSQLSSLGLSADAIMCANHITGIGSAVSSLVYEQSAFAYAKLAVRTAIPNINNRSEYDQALEVTHRNNLVRSSLALTEKLLELVCDILKFVPASASAGTKEARAGIGILIGAMGIYKVWKTS